MFRRIQKSVPRGDFGFPFLQQNESRVADSQLAAAIVRDLQKHV
jgi:hypothetical protein